MGTDMLPSQVLTKAHEIILERWSPQGDQNCKGGKRCAYGAVAEVMGLGSWWDVDDAPAGQYLDDAAASFTEDGRGFRSERIGFSETYEAEVDAVWVNDRPDTHIGDISDLFLDAIDDAKIDEADARKQVLALL